MKLRILGSARGECPLSFLLNDRILIDTGSACAGLSTGEIEELNGIFLSHAHLDHIYELPFILDRRLNSREELTIFASESTIRAIKTHLFNGIIWPDILDNLSKNNVQFKQIFAGDEVRIDRFSVIPLVMEHTIECYGFLISDNDRSLIYASDTSSLETIIEHCRKTGSLDLLLIECSFPDEQKSMARKSGHLVPSDIAELEQFLPPDTKIIITHIKQPFTDLVIKELGNLLRRSFEIAERMNKQISI